MVKFLLECPSENGLEHFFPKGGRWGQLTQSNIDPVQQKNPKIRKVQFYSGFDHFPTRLLERNGWFPIKSYFFCSQCLVTVQKQQSELYLGMKCHQNAWMILLSINCWCSGWFLPLFWRKTQNPGYIGWYKHAIIITPAYI